MKSHFSIVVWMMVVSVFMKMAVYAANLQFTGYEKIYFFGNLFVMMVGIFFGIRLFKSIVEGKTTFLADIKTGMKVAGMYAVLMSLFVYAYYTYIDPTYFDLKLADQLKLAEGAGITGKDLQLRKETGAFVLSPYFQSTVTLILYILLGVFYSSIITFFVRKVRRES
ncbi:MAG: DUF4199 domain-containing protein [Flavobacteriales bacterium]|nr:DUF4199 domain-containing protein [Flavobacteriales bacterium]